MTKPPYRIPTVAEVLAPTWPRNGLVAASLFAGCGGSSFGYRVAGWNVAYANEFVAHAADVYEANAPAGFLVDRSDVRTVRGADILAACGVDDLDLLDGSPPCQPFSTQGARQRSWGQRRQYGDHAQVADDLVYEFSRLVAEVRPRVFVMENVKGLVLGVAKGYFRRLIDDLRSTGYSVEARILDAQWLGVPQHRERVIVIGTRTGQPRWPTPFPWRYSIREALDADPPLDESDGAASSAAVHADAVVDLAKPCPTVMTVCSGWTGYGTRERRFTIPEMRRICGFPDDFVLGGTFKEQWARLGNSVVPPMATAVGRTISETLTSS